MKIFFACTTKEFETYLPLYKKIREYLITNEHVLTSDWIPEAEKAFLQQKQNKRDIKKIYTQVIRAIDNTDVSIIEATVPNYSVFHQISYSILRRKPTLVLWQKKDNKYFLDSYLEAVDSDFLTIRLYNLQNLFQALGEFLGYSKRKFGQERYNIILGNKQRYYLDWAHTKYNQSRSRIIRDAIDMLSLKDDEFNSYQK